MPTALVTGASAGLGVDFARLCAQNGNDVVLVARDRQRLEQLAAELTGSYGRNAQVIAADLSVPGASKQIYEALLQENIHPEILVNNAGFGLLGHFAELSEDQQMRMVYLNVAALTELTRLLLPRMIAEKKGYVLNVASTAAFQPGPLMAVYYATKSYVVSFSHAIDNELKDKGVRVTCLCPGPTRTEFAQRAQMTKTKLFNSRLAMDSATVAKIGYEAMLRGKPMVIAGRLNALMARLVRFVPLQFAATMARKFQEG